LKKISAVFLFLSLIVGLNVSPVCAESYLSGNIGSVSTSDSDIKYGENTGELSFDSGFSATGALGHTLGRTGRVEAELGYRINDIDKLKVDGLGTTANHGEITTISLMGNAYWDFATGTDFTPFVGAGIGVANIEAEIDQIGSDDDTVLAYQLIAGGSIAVTENLHIDLQYRYFSTSDPDFDGLEAEYNTHNLMVGLRLHF
jgi:opacity protein-like surface antigen